jgi:hypothetical protein
MALPRELSESHELFINLQKTVPYTLSDTMGKIQYWYPEGIFHNVCIVN